MISYNEQSFFMIFCMENFNFLNIKSEFDVENENDHLKSISDDRAVNIQHKSQADKTNDKRIEVPIQRTISTYKYCCICSATKNNNKIYSLFAMRKFYFKSNAYMILMRFLRHTNHREKLQNIQ